MTKQQIQKKVRELRSRLEKIMDKESSLEYTDDDIEFSNALGSFFGTLLDAYEEATNVIKHK